MRCRHIGAVATIGSLAILGVGLAAAPAAAKPAKPVVTELAGGRTNVVTKSGQPTAVVRAASGIEHAVTTDRVSASKTRIEYLSRHAGAAKWSTYTVPGVRGTSPNFLVSVEAHLSRSGKDVFAVFYQCDGVYISEAKVSAARLPRPTIVRGSTDDDSCADNGDDRGLVDHGPAHFAVALPGDRIGILLNNVSDSAMALWTGKAGGEFNVGPDLPTAHFFQPLAISRESHTGRLVVAGSGVVGDPDDPTTPDDIAVTTLAKGESAWSSLTEIGSLQSVSADYYMDSLVSGPRATYVGLQRPIDALSVGGHALYWVRGTSDGWTKPLPVRHTNAIDAGLVFGLDPTTGKLDAIWRHDDSDVPSSTGLMASTLLSSENHWSVAKRISRSGASISQLLFTASGNRLLILRGS